MKRIIGVTGPLAAGKDTAAAHLSEKLGIQTYQISAELRELAGQVSRQELIMFGRELAVRQGDDYLARRILERISSSGIIVGMRQIGQIQYLRANASLVLIGIDASPGVRFGRLQARGNSGDPQTLEEFTRIETKDDGEGVQNVSACIKLADYVMRNEGSREELYEGIGKILSKQFLY